MRTPNSPLSPEIWLRDLFASKAVQQGAVIRRKARDIERYVGMDLFLREIDRRGYQVAENSGQIIIFCNRAPIQWLTPISSQEIGPKPFQGFACPRTPSDRA
ncbi:aspartate aminotransferase [Roseibaca sp. Y0-43]|uniref:aspartate aminotransferase n=1 Tax=Roseibaca sp. Y0-43 TaxID=2816854 RepID=UPI001E166C6F|nr:aspartate aminotransferase [Roseibaca sp. Y0-43]